MKKEELEQQLNEYRAACQKQDRLLRDARQEIESINKKLQEEQEMHRAFTHDIIKHMLSKEVNGVNGDGTPIKTWDFLNGYTRGF